uniref:Protein BANP n=1 Tax=Clastoptera arizonana TaxID=38151 RepID=A0A1B6CLY2_9HEMI
MEQNKPRIKRLKTNEEVSGNTLNFFLKIIQQISDMQLAFNERFTYLENKMDIMTNNLNENFKKERDFEHKCCDKVMSKFESLEEILKTITQLSLSPRNENTPSSDNMVVAPIVLLPTSKPTNQGDAQLELDSNIQVITLNNECDYPEGCWLGDEKNIEARVRVPITQEQLLHINAICTTPEKMATVLLDYLFPQDVQAVSNLSGKGKHCKKQLDPLKIYAIRSHLMHVFNITERHWYRIKQNLDSKCRTAWRKKTKGLPFTNKNLTPSNSNPKADVLGSDSLILSGPFSKEESLEEVSFESTKGSQKHFKVLRATPEQLAKLQDLHTIKVYTDEELPEFLPLFSVEDSDYLTLSGSGEETLTIVTETGEVVVPDLNADDEQTSSSFLT